MALKSHHNFQSQGTGSCVTQCHRPITLGNRHLTVWRQCQQISSPDRGREDNENQMLILVGAKQTSRTPVLHLTEEHTHRKKLHTIAQFRSKCTVLKYAAHKLLTSQQSYHHHPYLRPCEDIIKGT